MKTNNKGFAMPSILILFGVLLIGGGVYYYFNMDKNVQEASKESIQGLNDVIVNLPNTNSTEIGHTKETVQVEKQANTETISDQNIPQTQKSTTVSNVVKPSTTTVVPKPPIQNSTLSTNTKYVETKNIRILYPRIGDKIVSGSDIVVKYELLNDISINSENPNSIGAMLVAGECFEEIKNKNKGIYSFSCPNVSSKSIGLFPLSILEETAVESVIPNIASGDVEVVLPDGVKATAFIVNDEDITTIVVPSIEHFAAAEFVKSQIKFSDGVIRTVPFNQITYSIEDTSIAGLAPNYNNYDSPFIGFWGKKVGKTTFHMSYQGIKKDLTITTVSEY